MAQQIKVNDKEFHHIFSTYLFFLAYSKHWSQGREEVVVYIHMKYDEHNSIQS